jgi:hypothetical protein
MNRYGTALLSLTTNRPPDPIRGAGLIHVEVSIPTIIANEIEASEAGTRTPVSPKEAATLLWSTPTASYINGRTNAWLDVPGVRLIHPGLDALMKIESAQWPQNQSSLQSFVAQAAPGSPTVVEWLSELQRVGSVPLINDLLLIFKYAALHRTRPLDTVAGLYRLVKACTTESNVPSNREEVIAWLTAPIVVPRIFVAPSIPAPAKPTDDGYGTGGGRPPRPHLPLLDLNNSQRREVLRRLEHELAILEHRGQTTALTAALPTGSRLTRTEFGEVLPEETTATGRAPVWHPRPSRTRQIVRTYIAGSPVLIDIVEFENRVSRFRQAMAQRLTELLPVNLRDRLTVLGVSLENLPIWADVIAAATQSPSYLEPIGRSDLLVVRQTTTGYRRAEIAYLENVLVGETRRRMHSFRVTTRHEMLERTEKEQEETRDLQVTDRYQLNREISNVLNEDLRAEGSVQVTSRGPTKVVASASGSFGRSTEEAAKTAEEYSRETVERAVNRTLERVTREVRSMIEQETIEVNRHAFTRDSTATDHVSGVYQYLERKSRAKIFWYGERELYDLLVPEPAALIWHLAISRKELHNPLERPDAELFDSLTLANIAEKREEVIRAFRVTDLPEFPNEQRQVGMPFQAEGKGNAAKYAKSQEIQIPEGYAAVGGTFLATAEVEQSGDDPPNGGWSAGNVVDNWLINFDPQTHQGHYATDFYFIGPQAGPTMAVGMHADNFSSLEGSITLNLQLTDEARKRWALEAYGRVAERYEQLRREYEQTVIQLASGYQAEITNLPEGSRLRLQQIVRFELQRAAIELMRNAPLALDLMSEYGFAEPGGFFGHHPSIDTAALHATEPEIRFLQQAFEWEHMSWVLYPYFWGQRHEWDRTLVQPHPDPDFAAFLNAGAARVQISVRPGFEHLVKHFMETLEVYGGAGLPKIGDPGYVSFIDEQLTSLGAPGEEVAWPPDAPREWDIVAPTSLVFARSLTQPPLPTWDPQTGEEV